jgi:Protein of unknown function (DUF1761)
MAYVQAYWWSVLLAAVASMVIGFLWYSPALFAKPWCAAMGIDMNDPAGKEKMKKEAGSMYTLAFIMSVIVAIGLSRLMLSLQVEDLGRAVKVGAAVWLCFVMTVQFTSVLFGGQKKMVFWINTGYQLVSYLVMAIIVFKLHGNY